MTRRTRRARLSLRVGGLGFRLHSADPGLGLEVDAATRRFCGPAGKDVCRLEVRRDDLGVPAAGEAVFECGESWTLRRQADGWLYDFKTPLNGSRPYRRARLARDFSEGEVVFDAGYLGGVRAVDPLQFPLAELLVVERLARRDGVELHACGLVDERGRGLLFAGRSGDGKTTTARLWARRRGTVVLSDDRVILRRRRGGWRMFGTPWHGEAGFARSQDAPLAAVFVLAHGPRSEAVAVPPAAAVAALLPCALLPFHDPVGAGRGLEVLAEVAGSVPCHRLPFLPDRTAVAAAQSVLPR